MAIHIINPNPVFDRTIALPALVPGTVMRTSKVEVTAGGKGVNVARILRALGVESELVFPVGTQDSAQYLRLLAEEGAQFRAFQVSGSVRVASIYRELENDRVTVVNDAGSSPLPTEWSRFVEFTAAALGPDDIVLIMGSLPAGLPPDAAQELVATAKSRGARVLLDTAPLWLAPALVAHPDVIAPNIHEAAAALGEDSAALFDDSRLSPQQARDQASDYALECASRTFGLACVTAGAAGVAYALGDSLHWIDAPEISVVSAVGAGDSFVAGLVAHWALDEAAGSSIDWHAAVAFGVACAAASCEVVRAGGASAERIHEIWRSLDASRRADSGQRS